VNNLQHGKGEQYWMTKSYESDRQHALEDRSKYTTAELVELDITSISDGGGRTNHESYEEYQFPFPMDQNVKQREKIDIREVDPTIGGK
jgi:hypothetical protein